MTRIEQEVEDAALAALAEAETAGPTVNGVSTTPLAIQCHMATPITVYDVILFLKRNVNFDVFLLGAYARVRLSNEPRKLVRAGCECGEHFDGVIVGTRLPYCPACGSNTAIRTWSPII